MTAEQLIQKLMTIGATGEVIVCMELEPDKNVVGNLRGVISEANGVVLFAKVKEEQSNDHS